MIKNKFTLVIDASRNRSGGAVIYLKNFIKHLNLGSTKLEKVVLFSHKNLLKQIPNKSFLVKKNHFLLEKNILFQIFWQWIYLPIYLKKEKINILYTTDSTTFCNYKNSIIFNQDILSFDKYAYRQISFGYEKIRLYFIRYIQIKAMNKAKELIFLSKFSQKIISKTLKKKINYKIIPHGIEKNLLKLGKKKHKNQSWDYQKKSKIRLIYVSPLFHYKNQVVVARVFNELKKKYNNLDIKFVGNFKNNLKIYNDIIKNNIHITEKNFIGEISNKRVVKYLYNSDIFVFASSSETFGISLLEAMALAMPIVCSNKSSLPEVLKDGGLYFDPNKDFELSQQIEKFIKDKKIRKYKSRKALYLSSKYNWKINTKQFNKIINKIY